MILYDGTSDIAWKTGELTAEQMAEMPGFEQLLARPSVLYDDGNGGVYSWRLLSSLCYEWGVEQTGDADADFSALVKAMEQPRPTIEEQVADAQSKSEEAAKNSNPQLASFAALALAPMAADMTDADAISVSSLWPAWSPDSVQYKVGDVRNYDDKLYRCAQDHTSQADWTPDTAASLWSRIDVAEDGVDVWTQPTGAHNAYDTGDRVHYPTADDPIYVSTIDGNTWAPDAYPQGWQLEE